MKLFLSLFLLITSICFSQEERLETDFNSPAHVIGGKADFDYVIQSQMIYPANLLKKRVKGDVIVHFVISSKGEVKNIEFKENYQPEFRAEVQRLLRYFIFEPALMGNVKVATATSAIIKFDPALYKRYTKQRGFVIHKESAKFDTSFVIHTMADSSPQYIKGDEEFNDYVYKNLEYPDLAIRQNIQGTVVLSFIVEPNGTISNVYAEKEFNHFCTAAALNVMKDTKWKPGTKDGKLVRYKMKYPIAFNINNSARDNSMGSQR